LREVFLRDIGLPPKRWMRAERMVVAVRKLAAGSAPEEVARDLGFASTGSFRREFLGFYQMPPLEFQRQRGRAAEGEEVES
jgi:methylphosphotriester-DNA--protein-cysteine methyltransferase